MSVTWPGLRGGLKRELPGGKDMRRLFAAILLIAVIASACSGCGDTVTAGQAGKPLQIALIAMDKTDPMVEAGAMKAAAETGANVVSMAAEGIDAAQQIRDAVSSGYKALIVASERSEEVTAALAEASDAGVKILYVDAPASEGTETVFAADDEAAGRAAGELMLETLKSRGVTSGVVGVIGLDSRACRLRASGFRAAVAGEAYTLMDTFVEEGDINGFAFVAGNYFKSEVAALFCCSEDATAGAGKALKTVNAKTLVMGWGQSEAVKKMVEDRAVQAVLTQDFEAMGYQAVMAAVNGDALTGGLTDTGFSILEAEIPPVEELLVGDFSGYRIAMIATDRINSSHSYLEEGVMKAAEELGCEVVNLTPVFYSDEEQIKQILQAVSDDCDAIMISAVDADGVRAALQEAVRAGVKVICLDAPAGAGEAVSVIMDHEAAGKTAGELMLAELEIRGITEGTIGIIGTNAKDEAALQREAGFRGVFEGTAYEVAETQYGEGDAALSHLIADAYIGHDVAAIYACSEGATVGAGNAAEDKRADVPVVGFGTSEKIQEMIESGAVLASVTKDPGCMGYEGVRVTCVIMKGGKPDGQIHMIDPYILTK